MVMRFNGAERGGAAAGPCKLTQLHLPKEPRIPLASLTFTHLHTSIMRVSFGFVSSLLLSGASIASAAAWSFEDATVSIATKGAGVGGASKDK